MAALFLEPVEMLEPKRGRRPLPIRQPGIERVMAMVELRDHMRGVPARQAAEAARRENWQDAKTKANALFLFALLAGALFYVMWAGTHGGG